MLNLYELANVIGEPLEVKVLSQNRFSVSFVDCETKDSKNSSIIGTNRDGLGNTIDEAADDYFKSIRGKWLVFDALNSRKGRREFSASIYQGDKK